jgi:conjugative relaxase-like TrwC/TraI family protein
MLVMSRGALSAEQAAHYYAEKYSADDYYSEGRQVAGEWFGIGAGVLGLVGPVAAEDFRAVLEGRDPRNGAVLVRAAATNGDRRAAWDATFNAPKSVSVAALVGGDTRVIEAHRRAVCRALVELEGFALSRRRGGREWVVTANIVAARFDHIAARPSGGVEDDPAPDPHLHTHVVIANMTRRADGQWRGLDPVEIYRAQRFATAVYRSELARTVQEFGYRIRVTAMDGRWELEGYSQAQLAAFSRRRRDIEEGLERLGMKGAATAQNLAYQTRGRKRAWNREDLAASWRARAAVEGINPEMIMCEARGRDPLGFDPHGADEALAFSVAHHTEREAVVDRRALEAGALCYAMGRTDLDLLRQAMEGWEIRGELLAASFEVSSPRGAYTTPDMLALERDNLRLARGGIGRAEPVAERAAVRQWASCRELSREQIAVAEITLTARDWVTCIEGHAGTAKTTTVGVIAEFAERQGYSVSAFAPTTRAVKALSEAGLRARTVASVIENPGLAGGARQLWLVDESSMLGTRNVNQLLRLAETAGVARLVLVGDQRQHHAIEAGRPVHQLQRAGLVVARLETIRRQRPPELREVVKLAARGDIETALVRLHEQGRIREVADAGARHQAIAREFLAAHQAGELALVVSPANLERIELNQMIHKALTVDRQLSAAGYEHTILVSRDLTRAQRAHAASYQAGDVVWYTRGSARLALERGSYARVESIDREGDRITVRSDRGIFCTYRPARLSGVQIFHEARRVFSAGDRIQFRAPNRALGTANGELATIIELDHRHARLRLDRGAELGAAWNQLHHVDYGYASTSHSSVGTTVDRVIVNVDTMGSAELVNSKQFYVSISRSRDQLTLYTDSRERLFGALARTREKSVALDRLPRNAGFRVVPDQPSRSLHQVHSRRF